jgi:ligand-binding sensor domain-containing protein
MNDLVKPESLLKTQEGDVWVGTNGGQAHIASAALDHFDRALVAMYHVGVGQSDQISCIHWSRTRTLWVGTSGGLHRFDRGNFSSIITHDLISRIEEISDGPNVPFHAEPARAASRIVTWPTMCTAKTTRLEEVRW